MIRSRGRLLQGVGVAALWLLCADPAGAFEGVLEQREVQIEGSVLHGAYATEHDGAPDDAESLVQWVLALTPERLVEIARSSGSASIAEQMIYIKGGRIRAELRQEGMPFAYVIADTETGVLSMVSDEQRMYVEIDPQEMKGMMDAAMEQARSAMRQAGMDETRIEQMLAQMRDEMGQGRAGQETASSPAPEMKPLDRSIRTGDLTAAGYAIDAGGGERVVGWIAPDTFGLKAAMERFEEGMRAALGESPDDGSGAEDALWQKGVPLRIQTFRFAGDAVSEFAQSDLLRIEPKSVPDELFRVPGGYARRSLRDLVGAFGITAEE